MRNRLAGAILVCVALCPLMLGCGTTLTTSNNNAPNASRAQTTNQSTSAGTDTTGTTLQMKIGDTSVDVAWESNESVEALKELCQDGPLTIQMSMYGDFEQVGSIGRSLPASDVQMTTQAGDIVLYAKTQIVVFYGSNSWSYTKLGHVADATNEEMTQLLGSEDVTITLEQGQ